MTKQSILEYKVGELEKKVVELMCKMEKLMTNEIPHLQKSIVTINGKIDTLGQKIGMAVAVNIVLMIGGVLGVVFLVK